MQYVEMLPRSFMYVYVCMRSSRGAVGQGLRVLRFISCSREYYFFKYFKLDAVEADGHKRVVVNATVVVSISV